MKPRSPVSRREFLQLTASAAAMLGLAGCAGVTIADAPKVRPPRPIQPGAKLRIAGMGFNNKGFADIRSFPGSFGHFRGMRGWAGLKPE